MLTHLLPYLKRQFLHGALRARPGDAAYEASGPSGQKIAGGAQQMGEGIAEAAGSAWNASAPTVSQVGSSVGEAASTAGAWVSNRASDAYNVSAPVVAGAAQKAGDMASAAGSWIANKTSGMFGGHKSQALTVKLNDRDLLDVQAQGYEVTIADTSSPPPPAGTTDAKTAVRAVIRVVGADVDPFNTQKQSDLMAAVLSCMTTVTASSARILYVAKVYPTSGRRLLTIQDGLEETMELGQPSRRLLVTASTNQADVNFQFLAFTAANVPAVQNELANAVKNSTGTDNALPTALQNQGHDHWGVTLESSVAAEPVSADFKAPCQNYFGSICLDGSGLSASAVKGIIAGGVIGVVLAIALLWCAWDVYHRRKKVYGMDETPRGTPDAIHGQRAVTGATALPHAKAAQVNAPNRGFWSRTFGGGGNQAVAPPSVPIQVAAQGAPTGSMTAAPHGYVPPSITPAPRP
ncbi:hypothetical protein WJX84_001960 [Apatococcus fuscideae]|uniref:Uncharacterized protein n=1 Tax=Apatococcus fuscideae TaxID=2026836 RepID=A0AAW1SQ25_9CHLO